MHPAANAGATLRVIWLSGKFHGVMQLTTPTGSRTTKELPTRSSHSKRRACLAALPQLNTGPPTCTMRESLMGMPTSRAIAWAISSARALRPSTTLSIKAQRVSSGVCDQASKAARAANTACSASSALPWGTVAITSSVVESCTANVWVEWALTHCPLM